MPSSVLRTTDSLLLTSSSSCSNATSNRQISARRDGKSISAINTQLACSTHNCRCCRFIATLCVCCLCFVFLDAAGPSWPVWSIWSESRGQLASLRARPRWRATVPIQMARGLPNGVCNFLLPTPPKSPLGGSPLPGIPGSPLRNDAESARARTNNNLNNNTLAIGHSLGAARRLKRKGKSRAATSDRDNDL